MSFTLFSPVSFLTCHSPDLGVFIALPSQWIVIALFSSVFFLILSLFLFFWLLYFLVLIFGL